MQLLMVVASVLLLWEANANTEEDLRCHNQDSVCSACIQTPGCQWCAIPRMDLLSNQTHRCFSVERNLYDICDPSSIENTLRKYYFHIIQEEPLSDVDKTREISARGGIIIQLTPQVVNISLSRGVPRNISVTYRQVKDYPLDLYYLMDLSHSMKADKQNLANLGRDLAIKMRSLTSEFKIGFGSFVDKVLMPFVNTHPDKLKKPCDDDCDKPYSFRNVMPLNSDDRTFTHKVNEAKISTNIDSPEGGFDALMQAMVCEKEIGWRKGVRKIIVLSTDALFHFAGDGKLAGVVVPNDAKCHLNEKGEYDKYHIYDYPSIGQINKVAKEMGYNIIFAVKEYHDVYKELSSVIDGSAHGRLTEHSSNVIDLVAKVYEEISGQVEFQDKTPSPDNYVSYQVFTQCKGNGILNTKTCSDLKGGDQFQATIELKLNRCPDRKDRKKKRTQLVLGTLQDEITINVEMLCGCDCEEEGAQGRVTNAQDCNRNGTYQCGVCQCHDGYYGNKCQCSRNSFLPHSRDGDLALCRPAQAQETDLPCSGRGICECGVCTCKHPDIMGTYCECNQALCRSFASNEICSGHGICVCDTCECHADYTRQFCECRKDDACIAKGDTDICSSHGTCDCGECKCRSENDITYHGQFCEECPTCGVGKCLEFRDCVQCKTFSKGKLDARQCEQMCTGIQPLAVESVDGHLEEGARLCNMVDEDDSCQFNFSYKYDERKRGFDVYVQSKRICPEKLDYFAIVFGVIGGIVAIGLLTLLIWKVLTTIHDRREYEQFEKERLKAQWGSDDNPLYNPPTTEVANPAFNT